MTQPATRTRRESTEAKRAEVLEVASRLFYEQGYHAVGMRAIGEAANIRAASLYHHFPSKEDLLFEAIQTVNRDFVDAHLQILDESGTHAERLTRLVQRHMIYMWRNKDFWWLSTREYRALSPEHLAEVQAEQRKYDQRLASFIRDGVRAGEFDCPDPHLTMLAMLGMINDPFRWFSSDGPYSIDELAKYYAVLAVERLFGVHEKSAHRPRFGTKPL